MGVVSEYSYRGVVRKKSKGEGLDCKHLRAISNRYISDLGLRLTIFLLLLSAA